MKRASAAVLLGLLLALLTGSAASAQYGETPLEEPGVTFGVQGAGVAAGEDLVVTGDGFLPGSEVLGTMIGPDGDPIVDVRATATVAADGTFRLLIPVPSDAPCGVYTVTIEGTAPDGSPRTIAQEVTVDGCAAEDREGGGILAVTGAQLGGILAVALAVLALGTLAVRSSRRREAP